MMPGQVGLDAIWKSYNTTNDAYRIVARTVLMQQAGKVGSVPLILEKHKAFYGQSNDIAKRRFDEASIDLTRWVVVTLVAAFERALRNHAGELLLLKGMGSDPEIGNLILEIGKDIEYWGLERVIDIFSQVDDSLRHRVKQIYGYRNWVAHGHWLVPGKVPDVQADPTTTYESLSEFMRQAGIA